MKAELTTEQIKQAWEFAEIIDENRKDEIRRDFLGAEIHYGDYNQDTEYGWCVEYVLSAETLSRIGVEGVNLFNEANVRVLFIGNYIENEGHPIGCYKTKFKKRGLCNKRQYVWQDSELSECGIEELKKQFNLTSKNVSAIFGHIIDS